mgnify:CR=1 FL=1
MTLLRHPYHIIWRIGWRFIVVALFLLALQEIHSYKEKCVTGESRAYTRPYVPTKTGGYGR